MTNQTIPPCPVCGTVPKLDSYKRVILTGECRLHVLNNGVWCKKKLVLDVGGWAWYCNQAIGRACREFGIETVEQLKAKMQPDPRVAVLEKKLAKLTDKLAMVEQESGQRLSAIIGYSDQLLYMKPRFEVMLSFSHAAIAWRAGRLTIQDLELQLAVLEESLAAIDKGDIE